MSGVRETGWRDMKIEICSLCEEQSKKTRNGKPHEYLIKVGEPRTFLGKPPRGFEEQDYQCLKCKSKFTWSTSKTDLAWTLWRG
jgi:hypothetical protein